MSAKLAENYERDGFAIFRNERLIEEAARLKEIFLTDFRSRFSDDPKTNRNIIKRFADHIAVGRFYCDPVFVDLARELGIQKPVFCGPVVSHYTSNDTTGNSFGLGYHQDWPSMASSLSSIVLWMNLADSSASTHSLEVAPGMHKQGLLEGGQADHGYILKNQNFERTEIIDIRAGEVLIMSSFLPHRTYVHPEAEGWKLSLSRRIDDMECQDWQTRGYANAYANTVDRELYKA